AETLVIVNHSAARARAAWTEVRAALAAAGVAFDAHEAREFGDARESAREAVAAGYRTVAVVGGDGTLSEVVNGFFAREIERRVGGAESARAPLPQTSARAALAVLPAGTGNDFARALDGRRASLEPWIARLVRHSRSPCEATTRVVDVLGGAVGDDARQFFCLNAVTLGIGAQVAARVAAQGAAVRRLSGEARFALAAAGELARWRERRVRVRVDDGEAFECATNLIAVVNSRFAGGGMMFSPDARVDDGLLDVVTARGISRAMLVREMTRIHAGGHVKNPRVSITLGVRVRIEPVTDADALPVEADGDVRGLIPLELTVVPGALRVVVGKDE
ncbi:MAG: diacylglycerol/lipid kinase family protein, partial [Pyrinomonadaceae bacterium]